MVDSKVRDRLSPSPVDYKRKIVGPQTKLFFKNSYKYNSRYCILEKVIVNEFSQL